jgi:hypothetical protein
LNAEQATASVPTEAVAVAQPVRVSSGIGSSGALHTVRRGRGTANFNTYRLGAAVPPRVKLLTLKLLAGRTSILFCSQT